MQPWPLVKKNRLDSLFHDISLTSNLNCSSAIILCVRTSMNETRSSLLPTAMVLPAILNVILITILIKIPNQNFNNLKRMVLPSGAQAILMFSPLVEMVAAAFDDLDSQIRTCFKKRKINRFYLIIITNFIFKTGNYMESKNCEPHHQSEWGVLVTLWLRLNYYTPKMWGHR